MRTLSLLFRGLADAKYTLEHIHIIFLKPIFQLAHQAAEQTDSSAGPCFPVVALSLAGMQGRGYFMPMQAH